MMKIKKVYTTAPLPFMGQKRRFLKEFKQALNGFKADATYVDLFGGSGLLSHTVKHLYPNATVVYNDFDNYSQRLEHIAQTNSILADLRVILNDYPKDKRIIGSHREEVLNRLKTEKGFVDWITISSSILSSGKYKLSYEEMEKETLYNCVRTSEYSAEGYLEGLQVVSEDYRALFECYKDVPNVVFLVDPPYLSTDVGSYKCYWRLKDYLDVLDTITGTSYFYFTSNKSSIIELCEWIETRTDAANPFSDSTKVEMKATVNSSASYTDIMLHKQWTTSIA